MLTIRTIPGRNIVLGREGENLARCIIFDIADWISAYGVGTVSLIAQRSGDTEPYPCNITVDGNTAVWSVTSADTAYPGYGKCELRYTVGDVLVKSKTWLTYTADALGTPAPELSPSERREQAYNTDHCIPWGSALLTATEASQQWAYYAAEGNTEKTDALTALIAEAKASIREQYPDT